MLHNFFRNDNVIIFISYCILSIISDYFGLTNLAFKIIIFAIIMAILHFKNQLQKSH